MSRRCGGRCEGVLHVAVQLSMKESKGGRGLGRREACGACVQNTCMHAKTGENRQRYCVCLKGVVQRYENCT